MSGSQGGIWKTSEALRMIGSGRFKDIGSNKVFDKLGLDRVALEGDEKNAA